VDKDSLTTLYKNYSSSIYGYAYTIVKNKSQAEDVLQETFTKAITHLDIDQNEKAIRKWLYITAKNSAIDVLRKEGHSVAVDELFETEAPPDNKDEIIMLNSALGALSDEERQVVMLHVTGGLKYKDIAEVLLIPQGTVGWIYSEARKKLKAILAG
jgi:RNA polymerase sigma-70 factor (ECF subfamily)